MTSQCTNCGDSRFVVSIPDDLSAYASGPAIYCCQRCLAVEAAERLSDSTADAAETSFEVLHRRFPTGTAGVGMLLLLEKLPSLALNRREIESLAASLESSGVDLFLTLERLCAEPTIEAHFDLERRQTQLEALLSSDTSYD